MVSVWLDEVLRYSEGLVGVEKIYVDLDQELVDIINGFRRQIRRDGAIVCSKITREFLLDSLDTVLDNFIDTIIYNSCDINDSYGEIFRLAQAAYESDQDTIYEDLNALKSRRLPMGKRLDALLEMVDPNTTSKFQMFNAMAELAIYFMPKHEDLEELAKAIIMLAEDVGIPACSIDHIHLDHYERYMVVYAKT